MTTVFISYASSDRALAEQLHRDLEATPGLDVWRDTTRLEFDWSREISQALVNDVDVLCLLWTSAAAASKWVQHEWLTVRALRKRIIPCLAAGSPPLPAAISHAHGIVMNDGVSLAAAVVARLGQSPTLDMPYDFSIRSAHADIPYALHAAV